MLQKMLVLLPTSIPPTHAFLDACSFSSLKKGGHNLKGAMAVFREGYKSRHWYSGLTASTKWLSPLSVAPTQMLDGQPVLDRCQAAMWKQPHPHPLLITVACRLTPPTTVKQYHAARLLSPPTLYPGYFTFSELLTVYRPQIHSQLFV